MTTPSLQECLDALPAEIRRQLDEIREIGRGPFGRAQTQQIVTEHLELLLRLRREYRATHADLVAVLNLCGITGPDGGALTAATLSSAISRALARSDVGSSKRRAQTPPRLRASAPSPVPKLHRESADAGDPEPDLVVFSTEFGLRGTIVANGIDRASCTEAPPPGRKAPEIRRSDHKERLIELLAQASMED